MEISLNGEPRTAPDGITIDALLQELGVKGRVAVMINDDIVKRERYAERKLADRDRIEVIAVVGGG